MSSLEVIDIVKSKLTEPYPSDKKLEALITEVGQSILNYCNIRRIPNGLYYVQANMVVDFMTNLNRKENPEAQSSVTSIKEGDTTVQLGGAKVETRERMTEQLLFDYEKQLNSFRKLRW